MLTGRRQARLRVRPVPRDERAPADGRIGVRHPEQGRRAAADRSRLRTVAARVGIALLLSGCATPVGVVRLSPQDAYRVQTASVLSTEQPSEPSKIALRRRGLLDRFEKEPASVLAELHRDLPPSGDEERLFALAELSFVHAERTGDPSYFLASAVYAYALLFPGEGNRVRLERSDPRLRLTYDLYNHGLAQGLTVSRTEPAATKSARERERIARGKRPKRRSTRSPTSAEVRLEAGPRKLPFGTLELEVAPADLLWAGYPLERFVSATTLGVRGLRNRYRRPGVGAPLAASLAPGAAGEKVAGSERIGPRTKVPVTAFVRLENVRASLLTNRVRGRLELYAADQASTVMVDGQPESLEFDSTAALAYQLDHNPIYDLELGAFLRGGFLTTQLLPRDRARDGLFTLHPYQSGKIPVVLVHGTMSSPTHWAELANELQGDPRIRERYQIWLFLYDSGNPIGYSAGRLRAALTTVVREFDPEGVDPALQRMVVIGHSQGGLLTKLTAIDTGTQLWDRLSDKPLDSLDLPAETHQLLKQSLFYTPLPFVARLVFISTPHRGALLATGRIGAIAASLIRLPTGLLGQLALAATASKEARLAAALRRPPTAVDNMNPRNPALRIVASIPVPPGTPAHSIISVKGDGVVEEGNDGVVAYRSAHIDEAVSELVVRSWHSCQGKPETIEEVRRILLEHAAAQEASHP